MEASMILNLSAYSENVIDVLKIFQQIGWDIYNAQGEVEYLPIGDKDDFDWQCEKIPRSELFDIVSEKISEKEMVGLKERIQIWYGIWKTLYTSSLILG